MGGPRRNRTDRDDTPKTRISRGSLKQARVLLGYVQPYRLRFAAGLVFLMLSSLTTLVFPAAIGRLVDSAMKNAGEGDFGNLNQLALFLVAALVAQAVFSYFRILIFVTVSERALADLRKDLYTHLIRLPMAFFGQRRVGELSSRLSSDISLIQEAFTTTMAELLRGLVSLLVGIVLIFLISWKLTLLMLASFPVMVAAAVVFGRFLRKISKEAQDRLADANVVVEETLQGIQAVKAYTNEWHEVSRYRAAINQMVAVALKGAKFRGAFSSFIIMAIFGGIILLMWYGGTLIQSGEISIGDLTSFLIYTVFVGGALGGFSEYYGQLQRMLGATERIRELLEVPAEPIGAEAAAAAEGPRLRGQVAFHKVAFAYPGRPEVPVLQDLSFVAEPGQKVALVGPSGAGKSTVISLLLQFYAPSAGQILVDGQPAGSYAVPYLRGQMAIVPQDVLLFGGSIRQNIAYGKLDATDAEIEAAARQANAHDFVAAFPEGYDTVVGERGVKLSGGQRQRIAIARAVLHNPAILLLDEATSSLDSESERLVQTALDRLMEGRTSIIIAHRLSTIRNVDKIVVLNEGRVAEQGTHDELMQRPDGLYRMLAGLQFSHHQAA